MLVSLQLSSKLELEVEVAVEHAELVVTSEVLTNEPVSASANVLLQGDISTELPTLLAVAIVGLEVISGSHGTRIGQMLVGNIETNLLGCLPIKTYIVGMLLVRIVNLRVYTAVVELQANSWAELIADTSGSDLNLVSITHGSKLSSSAATALELTITYTEVPLILCIVNISTIVSPSAFAITHGRIAHEVTTSTIVSLVATSLGQCISWIPSITTTSYVDSPVATEWNGYFSTGDVIIHCDTVTSLAPSTETTELNSSSANLTVYPSLVNTELRTDVAARPCSSSRVMSGVCIHTILHASMCGPLLVNLHGRSQAELNSLSGAYSTASFLVLTTGLVLITYPTRPLNVVNAGLELIEANTEVSQLIFELSSELVNHSLVSARGNNTWGVNLCQSLSDDLSHLITGHVLVATISAIRETINNALSLKLGYSVVCPVVSWNIGERISCCKSSGSSTYYQSGSQSGYESLLHNKNSSLKNIVI